MAQPGTEAAIPSPSLNQDLSIPRVYSPQHPRLPISATESNALFIQLGDYSVQGQSGARGNVRLAAAFFVALMGSTTAVSSLDAPQPRIASHQTTSDKAPRLLVAFTAGDATLAGIVLVP
jgi:hypothetical protein